MSIIKYMYIHRSQTTLYRIEMVSPITIVYSLSGVAEVNRGRIASLNSTDMH